VTDLPRKREEALYAKTLSELHALTYEQLVEQHDQLINAGGFTANPKYYRAEIERRDNRRKTNTMVVLTWVIAVLTLINVVAILVDVFG
jgi:hypothetical protein